MTKRMQFDGRDKAAFAALDGDTTIAPNGEVATVISGQMEVEVTRLAGDGGERFWLTIRFPGGEELDVRIARSQLLEQLDIRS